MCGSSEHKCGAESAAETVIYADALVSAGVEVQRAELRHRDGVITAVGERGTLGAVPDGAEVHDLTGKILIPGFTNGHTHSAMTLLRGVSDDNGFMPWLNEVQALEQHLTHADILAGLQLAMLEMIATGTVAFADMYYWDADLLDAVVEAGMRVSAAPAIVAPQAVMFPGVTSLTGSQELRRVIELRDAFKNSGQVRICYGPHAPYSVPQEFFSEVITESQRTGIPIHTHLAESPAETAQIMERHGTSPADYMRQLGLFETGLLAAHCVHLSDSEITALAAAGAALSHNPVSNLKIGNGVANLRGWVDSGVGIALGTDSVASNNSLDLFAELKLAALLQRGTKLDAAAMPAATVFEIATRGGAKAIGFPDTGELTVGKNADIVALDVTGAGAVPHANLMSHIVFSATGADVTDVWIGGRRVYGDRRHLSLDAAAVIARAEKAAARLRTAAGL